MSKLVFLSIIDPRNSFFKQPKSARAECYTVHCGLPPDERCDLMGAGQCINATVMPSSRCPYAAPYGEVGPTRRSGDYRRWIEERKDRYTSQLPDRVNFAAAQRVLSFVGQWVWLPYGHIEMNGGVPFLRHSSFLVDGSKFLRRSDWNLENVLKIVRFRPQAMMGGEIRQYQGESVPKFLAHLRERDPEMWRLLVEVMPELDKPPNYVGRKAILRTLRPGISWSTGHEKYPVAWEWDGTVVRTRAVHAYCEVWGKVAAESITMEVKPKADSAIVVQHNDWVTNETVLID